MTMQESEVGIVPVEYSLWEFRYADSSQFDLPDLPQYHLPELRGRRDKRDKFGALGEFFDL